MKRWLAVVLVVGAAACAVEDADTTDAADSAAQPVDSGAAAQAGPARDAQQEFLRSMSDHHEGLVRMGEIAMTRASTDTAQNEAHALHTKQAAERDSMVQSLERLYGERHRVQPMPKHVAQADTLSQLTGAAYDPTFYRMVIDHHREGIAMIDRYLEQLTDPQVRAMAERMKAEQQRDIEELSPKVPGGAA